MKKIECIKNKHMDYLCDTQSKQIAELENKSAVVERALENLADELADGHYHSHDIVKNATIQAQVELKKGG